MRNFLPVVLSTLLLLSGCKPFGQADPKNAELTPTLPVLSNSSDPVVLAAGDVANCRNKTDRSTANLIKKVLEQTPVTVLALGDLAYVNGTLEEFQRCFEPSWGAFKANIRPVPGNHEYNTPGASGYYSYFGEAAGNPDRGFYSFDLGLWHIVAINSNCEFVSCSKGSEQEKWLRADLTQHRTRCTLAYWHHPRFSSGLHGNSDNMADIWQTLYDNGADIVLSGHDHNYERFLPQDALGKADPKGVRQFVVGTGGVELYLRQTYAPNNQVWSDKTWGVLMLVLHPDRYDWQFLATAGKPFTDSGSTVCN